VALDDDLNRWKKLDSNPITPKTAEGDDYHGIYRSWDPYGWIEDDRYYAIFGGNRPAIVKSDSMEGPWKYVGDLMANTVDGVSITEDVSCADFFKIGDKRMLLCISHRLGCRYYLGRWENEQFHPEFHEKMSWIDNSFFAPESLLDDQGRRIMWAWIFDKPGFGVRDESGWSGTMSLPRVLSLAEDGTLRMDVPKEIENLRCNSKVIKNIMIDSDSTKVLEGISGNSIELAIEMISQKAVQMGVKVCCSPDGAEETLIYYDPRDKKLKIDTRKSGLTGSPKGIEAGPFELKEGEPLKLRVFVDKSVVEVFANERQAIMRRIYPDREDSFGVILFSNGGPAHAKTVEAWDIMPSNPY
jgi:beta-fructofuranosidase